MTGIISSDFEGRILKNGFPAGNETWGTRASTCGRYVMKRTEDAGYSNPMIELRAMEGLKPLFRIEGVAALDLRVKGDYVRATNRHTGDPLPRISPLRLGFGLDYSISLFDAALDVTRTFGQNRVADNELQTDGYTMVDATVSYHLPTKLHLDAFVKATNLLDEEAREHTSVLKYFAPLGGRSVLLGIRGEF